MDIDYIRVYRMSLVVSKPKVTLINPAEDPNARNIGCDPPNMPTSNYIARYGVHELRDSREVAWQLTD